MPAVQAAVAGAAGLGPVIVFGRGTMSRLYYNDVRDPSIWTASTDSEVWSTDDADERRFSESEGHGQSMAMRTASASWQILP